MRGDWKRLIKIQGCMALAEAKGYNGGVVAGIVAFGYVFSMIGSCVALVARLGFLGLFLMMPVVLLFGFKDKYRGR